MRPTGFAQISVAATYRSSPGLETRLPSWSLSPRKVLSIRSVIAFPSPQVHLVERRPLVATPAAIWRGSHVRSSGKAAPPRLPIVTDYSSAWVPAAGAQANDCRLQSHRSYGRCAWHQKPLPNLGTSRRPRAWRGKEWSSDVWLSPTRRQIARVSALDRTRKNVDTPIATAGVIWDVLTI